MSHHNPNKHTEGRVPDDWAQRITAPKATLGQLRSTDPVAWSLMQEFIHLFVSQNPELVRLSAQEGIAGERLHKLVEGMLDLGLLKIVREGPFFRAYVWHPGTLRYEPAGS